MPNYSYCMNCGGPKTPDEYGNFLCKECKRVANEAENYAVAENLDVGAARKAALSARAPSSMAGKHPAMPFDRVDTTAIEERMKNGPIRDPRMYKSVQVGLSSAKNT